MIKTILTAIILSWSTMATANTIVKLIPQDSALRLGTLSNGLTYYIVRNNTPEHRVNFYIAQCVGSMQEEEHQRGLAHFLEHMCFNGTENFPGNQVISYLESLGVKFGQDLNAYTAIDRTVYNINNVPSARISALDSCLLILRDWSCGLTLDSTEIEKERGVIHEEWRQRNSASFRLLERNIKTLYSNSKYARRMPIGLMEIVDSCKPEALRAYYHQWYIPRNQAIVVVGDVDIDRTEKKIKELFSSIKNPENILPVVDEPVPDNDTPIVVIDKDREQQSNVVQIMFKQAPVTKEMKRYEDYYTYLSVKDMAIGMLVSRLTERTQEVECPYTQVLAGFGSYMLAKTKYAFQVSIVPKEGKILEAAKMVMEEVQRALQHGYTTTEFARFKAKSQNVLERYYMGKDKRNNAFAANGCIEHFLSGEPIPSIEDYYRLRTRLLEGITLEDTHRFLQRVIPTDNRNMVVVNFYPDKDGYEVPTEAQLLSAISVGRKADMKPYVDFVKDEPLIPQLPKKGKIVSCDRNKVLDFQILKLSNGARVILKKTEFKKDEILLNAYSRGGSSLLDEPDFINMQLFNRVVNGSGLGNFSLQELDKFLVGKTCNVNFSLDDMYERLTCSTAPRDLEQMMQMLYLYFTNIKKDEQSFNKIVEAHKARLKNIGEYSEMTLQDSLLSTLHCKNPRYRNYTLADLEKIDYNRILQIARERTANASDFTFIFIGNYDEAKLFPLIEQYIASLPAVEQRETWRDVHTYATGEVINRFYRKMDIPKAKAYFIWQSEGVENSLTNRIKADVTGQILTSILIRKIREEASAAYSVDCYGSIKREGNQIYLKLYAICPFKPEKADIALKIMRDELNTLASHVDGAELDKVKKYMVKRHVDQMKQNYAWMKALETYQEEGLDEMTEYNALVTTLTPTDISQFVRTQILASGNHVEVVMLPESRCR